MRRMSHPRPLTVACLWTVVVLSLPIRAGEQQLPIEPVNTVDGGYYVRTETDPDAPTIHTEWTVPAIPTLMIRSVRTAGQPSATITATDTRSRDELRIEAADGDVVLHLAGDSVSWPDRPDGDVPEETAVAARRLLDRSPEELRESLLRLATLDDPDMEFQAITDVLLATVLSEDPVERAPSGPWAAGAGGVTVPVRIQASYVPPSYPDKARRKKLEGRVILQVVVRSDGSVGDIEVLHCNKKNAGFEDAAVRAVERWRYTPAQKDGKPVDVFFAIAVISSAGDSGCSGDRFASVETPRRPSAWSGGPS